jgi:hypothetical protein
MSRVANTASNSCLLGGEARIVGQFLTTDRRQERPQLPFLVEQRHDEPAPIPALIMIRQRVRRLFARRTMRHRLAEQAGLHETAIRP